MIRYVCVKWIAIGVYFEPLVDNNNWLKDDTALQGKASFLLFELAYRECFILGSFHLLNFSSSYKRYFLIVTTKGVFDFWRKKKAFEFWPRLKILDSNWKQFFKNRFKSSMQLK